MEISQKMVFCYIKWDSILNWIKFYFNGNFNNNNVFCNLHNFAVINRHAIKKKNRRRIWIEKKKKIWDSKLWKNQNYKSAKYFHLWRQNIAVKKKDLHVCIFFFKSWSCTYIELIHNKLCAFAHVCYTFHL